MKGYQTASGHGTAYKLECEESTFYFSPSGEACEVEASNYPACVTTSACAKKTDDPAKAACPVTCDMLPEGSLSDFSTCSMAPGQKVIEAVTFKGTVSLTADKCMPEDIAAGALAASFDLDASLFDIEVDCTDARRLASQARGLESHATKKSAIAYTAYVPSAHAEKVRSKVKELDEGGAAADAFVKHASEKGGVTVDKDSIKAPKPTETKSVMVVDKDGVPVHKPVAPKKPSPAPAPAPASEEGGNTAAIVGGVVGGLVGLALIGGIAYYFLVARKKEG